MVTNTDEAIGLFAVCRGRGDPKRARFPYAAPVLVGSVVAAHASCSKTVTDWAAIANLRPTRIHPPEYTRRPVALRQGSLRCGGRSLRGWLRHGAAPRPPGSATGPLGSDGSDDPAGPPHGPRRPDPASGRRTGAAGATRASRKGAVGGQALGTVAVLLGFRPVSRGFSFCRRFQLQGRANKKSPRWQLKSRHRGGGQILAQRSQALVAGELLQHMQGHPTPPISTGGVGWRPTPTAPG